MRNKESNSKEGAPKKKSNVSNIISTLLKVVGIPLAIISMLVLVEVFIASGYDKTSSDCKNYEIYYRQTFLFDKGYCTENFDEEWVCLDNIFIKEEFFEKNGFVMELSMDSRHWDGFEIEGWKKIEGTTTIKAIKEIKDEQCDEFVKIKRRVYS